MELKNIVLHHIKREENQLPILNCSDHLLPPGDEAVTDFVDQLIKSFGSKNPTYGTFQDDDEAYPFQRLAKRYINGEDFLNFTVNAMRLLEKEIQVPQAKGGYVVFVHYMQNQVEFLFTIMLDKSEQFSINDDSLDIQKLLTLDIDRLARGNRLNLSKWPNSSELYLAFIKGTRDVSGYFQKFIGNTDLTSSKTNSKNLKKALSKYMRENNYDEESKSIIQSNVSDYIESQYESDSDVQLTAVSARVNQDNPNDFIDYIQEAEDINVSGSFRVTRKSDYSSFHKSVVSGNGFKLEFEQYLVQQGKIVRDGNNVIITDIPDEILDLEFNTGNENR